MRSLARAGWLDLYSHVQAACMEDDDGWRWPRSAVYTANTTWTVATTAAAAAASTYLIVAAA